MPLCRIIYRADDENDELREYLKELKYPLFDIVNASGFNIFHKAVEKKKRQKIKIMLEHA